MINPPAPDGKVAVKKEHRASNLKIFLSQKKEGESKKIIPKIVTTFIRTVMVSHFLKSLDVPMETRKAAGIITQTFMKGIVSEPDPGAFKRSTSFKDLRTW